MHQWLWLAINVWASPKMGTFGQLSAALIRPIVRILLRDIAVSPPSPQWWSRAASAFPQRCLEVELASLPGYCWQPDDFS